MTEEGREGKSHWKLRQQKEVLPGNWVYSNLNSYIQVFSDPPMSHCCDFEYLNSTQLKSWCLFQMSKRYSYFSAQQERSVTHRGEEIHLLQLDPESLGRV